MKKSLHAFSQENPQSFSAILKAFAKSDDYVLYSLLDGFALFCGRSCWEDFEEFEQNEIEAELASIAA